MTTPPQPRVGNTLLFHRLNDLTCLWYVHTKRMQKLDRYTLGQKIIELLIEILVLTLQAGFRSSQQKLATLSNISPKLDTVKVLIRLTHKLGCINEADYIRFESILQESGKMLGGWMNDVKSKAPLAGAPN